MNDTICAPATSVGSGAVSMIRISGNRTFEIIDSIVSFRKGDAMSAPGYSIKFGTIHDVDDVLVSIFRAPHSYTGEDSAELSCHASQYIVGRIMELLNAAGARTAEPGEFTKRAFLNGKMDLVQAEAVADVIMAESEAAHRVASMQMRGGFSKELKEIRDKLLEITSLLELELDFSEEDVEFADRHALRSLTDSAIIRIDALVKSFRLGNAIKKGVPVAIVGATNTGKSTLLNALLGDERAIVSDIAGTTRDTIEETMNVGDTLFRFIDTAGIRASEDTIERIGIKRTFDKIGSADIILGVVDISSSLEAILQDIKMISEKVDYDNQKLVILANKIDKTQDNKKVIQINNFVESIDCQGNAIEIMTLSAMTGEGVNELKAKLQETQHNRMSGITDSNTVTLVTNIRHKEALEASAASLRLVRQGLESTLPGDLIAQDLREAIYNLGTITGSISTDEILGRIFEKFCIGK